MMILWIILKHNVYYVLNSLPSGQSQCSPEPCLDAVQTSGLMLVDGLLIVTLKQTQHKADNIILWLIHASNI